MRPQTDISLQSSHIAQYPATNVNIWCPFFMYCQTCNWPSIFLFEDINGTMCLLCCNLYWFAFAHFARFNFTLLKKWQPVRKSKSTRKSIRLWNFQVSVSSPCESFQTFRLAVTSKVWNTNVQIRCQPI